MARQDVLLVALLVASTLHATYAMTAYDLLERYSLPRGLLPQGVESYRREGGGVVEVTLPGECNFFVSAAGRQYKFRYDKTVRGALHRETIDRVSGARIHIDDSVWHGAEWFGINQVIRVGDVLTIHTDKYLAAAPVSAFATCPRCD